MCSSMFQRLLVPNRSIFAPRIHFSSLNNCDFLIFHVTLWFGIAANFFGYIQIFFYPSRFFWLIFKWLMIFSISNYLLHTKTSNYTAITRNYYVYYLHFYFKKREKQWKIDAIQGNISFVVKITSPFCDLLNL